MNLTTGRDSKVGKKEFFEIVKKIPAIDPKNIQFCCAEWFWNRQVNSYVLQVEPDRYKHKDKVKLGLEEAQKIEIIRNNFFAHLNETLEIK